MNIPENNRYVLFLNEDDPLLEGVELRPWRIVMFRILAILKRGISVTIRWRPKPKRIRGRK